MDKPYTVAIITGQLVVGGAERQLFLWLSNLDREKFYPVVLTLHPDCGDYWEKPVEALGIPLLRVPRRYSRLLRLFEIIRALRPYKPKLIQGWHLFASPYAGVAAKLLGAKSLGGLRDTFRTFSKHPLEASLTMWLVDAMLVNSKSAADGLRAGRSIGKQTIYAVQNAVEDIRADRSLMREKLSQSLGISKNVTWLGALGRLDPKKRFDLLLNEISLIKGDIHDFHFLLIGDGPERARLETMVDELAIREYITFAGEIPQASSWLSALDIFCFTSLDEGMPNVIMEAAVAGLPIVSWRVPFMEELLEDGRMALLVEPGNAIAFKNAALDLIRSPELRHKIGDAGRNHVLEKFTMARYIQQMTVVYEDLLDIPRTSISGGV